MLISISLFFVSCQKDDNFKETESTSTRSQWTIRELSAKDVQDNESLFAEIQKFNALQKTTYAKGGNTDQESFKIGDFYNVNYDYGKEIIYGEHHSYTFPLVSTKINKSPFLVFNMVFSQKKDESYSKRVVAYNFTEEQLKKVYSSFPITGKIDLVSFDPDEVIKPSPVTSSIVGDGLPDPPSGYHWELFDIYYSDGIATYDYILVENEVEPQNPSLSIDGRGTSFTIFIPGYGPPFGDNTPVGPYVGDHGGYIGSYGGTPGNPNSGSNPENSNGDDNGDGPVTGEDDSPVKGGSIITTPVINPPEEPDPCDDVQNQFDDQSFKNKIKNLRNALNQNNEKGYAESTENTFPPLSPSGHDHLVLPINPHIFAYMHTHPNGSNYKIFSPADFNILHKLIVQAQFSSIEINGEMDIQDVYAIVIANDKDENGNTVQSNYMIKFSGDYSDIHLKEPQLSNKKLIDKYRNYMYHYRNNKEKAFIKMAQNKILDNNQTNFKNSGFHLFKFNVDEDGKLTQLEEKSLDDQGNLQSNSCE